MPVISIAVSSQNRLNVTAHAGKCRRFWIYRVENGSVTGKDLLELDRAQTFHEADPSLPHPLYGVDVLITGGMGGGLSRTLSKHEVMTLVTTEANPDTAISLYLKDLLPEVKVRPDCCGGGPHVMMGRD